MLKKLGSKLKEQKGFTLIELLAVIVILGIIAAIAIPAIGNVINKSEKKAQVQEGLLIIDAAKMYVANNPKVSDITLNWAGTGTLQADGTGSAEISLKDYLDRVDDNTFVVDVELNPATGKYTYSLTVHGSVALADKGTKDSIATEQELIEYTN
jgi:type IV pilus assembly protein PilA